MKEQSEDETLRAIQYLAGTIAVLSYAILIWTLFTSLLPEAAGLWPFDLRATGYSPAEAGAYLAALTEDGRALLLGPVALADTVFPVALALWLALGALRQGPGRLAWIAALLALAYLGSDLAENAAVRRLVEGPIPPDPLIVSGASTLTVTKYATLAAAFVLTGLAWFVRRR